MGRPLRIEFPGALYHITSRGNERKNIFLDDSDRFKFFELLKDYHDRYGILLHCFVLMDNHYHLILETPKGNLLKVMHAINGGYTGYFKLSQLSRPDTISTISTNKALNPDAPDDGAPVSYYVRGLTASLGL